MNKLIKLFLILAIVSAFFVACDMETPVSQSERIVMWVDDYNTGNYSSIRDHFDSGMTDYLTLISDPDYWDPGLPPTNTMNDADSGAGFTITTNAYASSTTRTVVLDSAGTLTLTVSFIKDSSISSVDVWLINGISGTFTLN